jgi:opacity protein-like surface antigen
MNMKTIKISLFVLGILCMVGKASAQMGTVKLTADYSFALPMSDLKDFVDNKSSARGWNADIMYGITNKLSLGAGFGYQSFSKKYRRQIYHTGGSDISAVLNNSVEIMPLQVMAKYNFLPSAAIQPYVMAGVGAQLALYRQTLGEYDWDSRNRVGFAATPAAGIIVPLSKRNGIAFNAEAAYNYMPFNYGIVNNLNNLAIRGGLTFELRGR